MKVLACLAIALFCLGNYSFGQVDSSAANSAKLPNKIFARIDNKTENIDDALTNQSTKYLRRFQKQDEKIQAELYKVDSNSASKFNANGVEAKYNAFMQKIKKDSAMLNPSMGPEYLPYLDSLKGALAFLNKNPQLLSNIKMGPAGAQNALDQVNLLQTKMQDADQIKQFIQSRNAQIQQILSQYTQLPPGITSLYNNYKAETYYYSQQVRTYREMLNDPDKMEQTALQLLDKIPAFTSFMQKNSFLAGLFGVPENYGTADGMVGLQSRDQILALIKAQMGGGGANAESMIQQNLQAAQQDINKIRDKISAMGAGNGTADMPNFKPQNQKAKTFFGRLDFGTSLQTEHANDYYPTTTTINLSAAYRLDDKKRIGIKVGYIAGWGTDINHIKVTAQGFSSGAFVDFQLKRSIYITGGFDLNYQQPLNLFHSDLALNSFTKSGTIGIGKTIKINKGIFKKSRVQVLWDFLSYYQHPPTTPILFQVGYDF